MFVLLGWTERQNPDCGALKNLSDPAETVEVFQAWYQHYQMLKEIDSVCIRISLRKSVIVVTRGAVLALG